MDHVKIERYLLAKGPIAVDLETTGLSWQKDHILGVALSDGVAASYFWWDQFTDGDKDILGRILRDETRPKVFHNAKFDLHFLREAGFEDVFPVHDTMIMSILSNENGSHKLKDLAQRIIDPNAKDAKEKLVAALKEKDPKLAKNFSLENAPRTLVAEYARMDPWYTIKLYDYYKAEIEQKYKSIYENEMNLLFVVMRMEREGIRIDQEFLTRLGLQYEQEAEDLAFKIRQHINEKSQWVPTEMNLNSDKQLVELLEKGYGLTLPLTKSKKSKRTDALTLSRFEEQLPILTDILRYRQLCHLTSTYCKGITDRAVENIIHCEFMQNGAVTGRFSCVNPNLQNIPKVKVAPIKRAFLCEPGYILLSGDYDQVEYKLLGHYANDPKYIQAVKDGLDIHRYVASQFFKVPIDQVTDDQRDKAKTINFGIVYGLGMAGFATKLKVSTQEAKEFLAWYNELFPKVKEFKDSVMDRVRQRGFVFNSFGRYRRHAWDEAYIGVNSLIQGCAADVIKHAMVKVDAMIRQRRSGARLLIQVHDDLIFKIPIAEANELIPEIKRIMEDFPQFRVPLTVSLKYSFTNWGDCVKWEGQVDEGVGLHNGNRSSDQEAA